MRKLEIMPDVVIRHPLRPRNEIRTEQEVLNYFQNHFAAEALFTSSPSLFRDYKRWENGKIKGKAKEKLILSLYRYYLRMHNRATPFGLLAATSYTSELSSSYILDNTKKRVRLDYACLHAIVKKILSNWEASKSLHYRINSSLYELNSQYRFMKVDPRVEGDDVKICSLKKDPLLDQIIEKAVDFTSASKLLKIIQESANVQEGEEFLRRLIDLEFLVPHISLSLSEDDQLSSLIKKLTQLQTDESSDSIIHNWVATLTQLKIRLIRLEKREFNRESAYLAIQKFMRNIGIDLDLQHIFRIDTCSRFQSVQRDENSNSTLHTKLCSLIEYLSVQNKLRKNENLNRLKKKFNRRYGNRSVPLLELMDPDVSIGYGNNNDDSFKFTNDLKAIANDRTGRIGIGETEVPSGKTPPSVLNKKVDLSERIQPKGSLDYNKLPASFSILCSKIVDDQGHSKFLIKDIGGAHALHYIGRFCSLSPSINFLAQRLAKHECEVHKPLRLVEFYHQSHLRSSNINTRPLFFESSIDYLDNSSEVYKRILTGNLSVKIEDDKLILFQSETGERLILRISSAHDHRLNTLPLYRFVGDLQSESVLDHLDTNCFSSNEAFAPRVELDNLIVQPACWTFRSKDLLAFLKDKGPLNEWFQLWSIPKRIKIGEADRELVLNWDSKLDRRVFEAELLNNEKIIIKEHFLPDPAFLKNKDGNTYSNELLFFVKNHESRCSDNSSSSDLLNAKEKKPMEQNESNWLYLKLYCNPSQLQKLFKKVFSSIEIIRRKELICSWFFIRYRDPDHHIRIRFKIKDKVQRAPLFELLMNDIDLMLRSKVIWKYQFDKYLPEYNRYGYNQIEVAEKIFEIDSESILRFYNSFKPSERDRLLWRLGLLFIHDLFDLFEIEKRQRVAILHELNTSFKKEFSIHTSTLKSIAKEYRDKRDQITRILGNQQLLEEEECLLIGIAAERSLKIQSEINRLEDISNLKRIDLMLNLMHMSMNRLFSSAPRYREYLSYEFLWTHYRSELAKKRSKKQRVR